MLKVESQLVIQFPFDSIAAKERPYPNQEIAGILPSWRYKRLSGCTLAYAPSNTWATAADNFFH
jgi:hypothetical protein